MKIIITSAIILLGLNTQLSAQRSCMADEYLQKAILNTPSLAEKIAAVENYTAQQLRNNSTIANRSQQANIITIPVVVHILYHYPSERMSEAQVIKQMEILNRDFRRMNADSINTPARFKSLAADCEIEFRLATVDPKSRATNGIIYKYSPIEVWESNDKMKYAAEMGDDAWDAGSYLNIWVCRLDRLAGYASFPGGPAEKDGIVLDFGAFGQTGSGAYGMGRTAVHETGHWLNLKHTWGDANCGDDKVDDTPQQSNYTVGCPSTFRSSCGNAPLGDMYMNYMDFTNDACINLFTIGQKNRMRALFAPGGARFSILSSRGLGIPQSSELPLPNDSPRWLHTKIYPVPATDELTLDIVYDERWVGKMISILNLQGQVVDQVQIRSGIQKINISKLPPGIYFLSAKRGDKQAIKEKFIKL